MAPKRRSWDKPTKVKMSRAVLETFRALGAQGGEARAKNMTAAERSESARRAVQARWRKAKKK